MNKMLHTISSSGFRNVRAVLLLTMLLFAGVTQAAHFRSGTISWRSISGNTVEFKVSQSYGGWAFGSGYALGSTQVMDYLYTGNGFTNVPIPLVITSINAAEGWWYGEATFQYTYPSAGNYTAYFQSCCRISNLSNNGDQQWRNETIVNVGSGNSSPVSTIAATVNLPQGLGAAQFQIPAFDPDGDVLSYRLATSAEMGGGSNPSGLSIDPTTGVVSFNTIGKGEGTLWNVAFTISDGPGKTKVTVDFVIKITQNSTPPIFDYLVTPVNGRVFQGSPGQTITFPIKAYDNDAGNVVTLSAVGLPPGSTTSPSLPSNGNPVNSNFSWTPAANQFGSYVINFTATDNVGVQSTSSVTILISLKPTFNVPPTPAQNSETYLETGVAHQSTISVSDPDPNDVVQIMSVTGLPSGASLSTSLPTVASNPRSIQLNWTPTPSNFGIHTLTFTAKDSYNDQTTHSFKYLVNTKPTFTSSPTTSVYVGQPYTYTITGLDPDVAYGDIVQLIGGTIPSWLTFTNNGNGTGTLSGTPTSANMGNHPVVLKLEDTYHHDYSPITTQSFVINVSGVLPSIEVPTNIISCDPIVNFAASETVGIPASTITYSIAPGSTFPIGTTTVTATATNAVGTSTNTFTVTVNKPIAVITASGPTTICAGTSVTLTASSGASYLWSNGATTQSITVSTPGSYTVDVTNANGCTTTSAATTVANVVGVDSDGDGVPDACDADDDNDGILDIVECNKSNFYWSNPPNVNGNSATGVINGVNYTYTSSRPVETTPSVFAHNVFPSSFGIPNIKSIKNISISNNTLTFASPVTNPVLVFSSIGQPNLYVPIEFSSPIEILWSTAVVKNSSTRITGNEGYAVIRLNGTFSSISFNYLADENWVNFLFGADFQTCGDTDGDGIPDKLDTDSDNDGCPDAIEGSQNPTLAQTLNGRLTGGVDASGIPTLVNGGQGIGTSQNANLNCFCQAGIDKTAPVITCVTNIEINASSASGAVVNYITPTATDDCAVTITRTAGLASGSVFPIGTTIITHTATDAAGNISSCSFTITVLSVPPVIVVPTTINVNAPSNACGAVVNFAATETTAIPASTITYSHQPGSTFPVGTTVVTATATNAVGTSEATFEVTVKDVTAPTIAATSNINAIATSANGAVVNYTLPTATDNCSGVISVTASPVSGSVFQIGITTVTVTATDAAGNTATSSFTVTVVGVPPVIVVPTNITVNNDAANCGAAVNFTATEATAIPASTITYSHAPGSVFPVGTTTVTATASNAVGTSTGTFTVTVTDNEKPVVITRPVSVTLVNGSASVTAADVNNGSTDNCGIQSVVLSGKTSYTCSDLGMHTVTLTVTDIHGNVQTATAVVTVNGQLPTSSIVSQPTSSVYTGGNANNLYLGYGAQSTVLRVNATGGSSYTYQWIGAATNMLNSTTSGVPVFTPTAAGTYTFTVIVTNNFGCTTSSKITICVRDIRVPGAKGAGKVYLCHLPPGNNQNPQTLEISVNAVAAHLTGHSGDRLGSCATAACVESAPTVIATNSTSFSKAEEVVADDLKVVVMPNPSSTYFTLKLVSQSNVPVNIKVVDAAGRLVEGKAKQAANSTLQLGHNYATGSYFAEFIQGNQRKVVQLIKIK